MQGRRTGTPGDVRGTTYIATEAARLGLVGGGEGGTFFQGIPLYRSAPLTSMRVISGSTHFLVGRDFIPVDNSAIGRVQQIDGSRVVFGGTMGDTIHMLGRRDGNERLVVVAVRTDSAGRPERTYGRRELIYRFSGVSAIAVVGLRRHGLCDAGPAPPHAEPSGRLSPDQRRTARAVPRPAGDRQRPRVSVYQPWDGRAALGETPGDGRGWPDGQRRARRRDVQARAGSGPQRHRDSSGTRPRAEESVHRDWRP